MKIKTTAMDYDKVLALTPEPHQKPIKPPFFFRLLLRLLSIPDLSATKFTCRKIGMDKLSKKEPCLVLMNHSSFIDLKIASKLLFPRCFNIVCTSDGFVGKAGLMRRLGCIPTQKFVTDPTLVRDMLHAVRRLGNSILMYPEASYSFDGTATPLPSHFSKCIKMLGIPVVMIRTYGAFARDPLYNGLRLRKVQVSADMEYLLSPEQIARYSNEQIEDLLKDCFGFDNFRWQQENKICIDEPFRAEGLNRVLYKCPHCMEEGKLTSKGSELHCEACGKSYELSEYGFMQAKEGETEYPHIPDWYAWERECVRKELQKGSYKLDIAVDIGIMVDSSCIYRVGEGRLQHGSGGFILDGCGGKLHYEQKPSASYSLYADYFWYEIGDMICIGNNSILYYCFPKGGGDIVAKTRLAAEELYKMLKQ